MTRITKKVIKATERNLLKSWPLRKSEARWAGGGHYVSLYKSNKPGCTGWSKTEWSSNGKWSGSDSYVSLTATRQAFIHFPGLIAADGAIILDAEQVTPREYRVVFVKQGRGFGINPANGWMVRGYLSTRKNITSARKQAAGARSKQVAAALMQRQRRIDSREYREFASRVWVSLNDSIDAGNCKSISEQVESQARRKYGNIGAIRGDALLNMRDDYYSRRAIEMADKNHSKGGVK